MELTAELYATLLGILQGLTEFLPVSSSGHLIIVSWLLDGKPLPLTLNIALHLGTLGAVLVYFWRDWWNLTTGVYQRATGGEASYESDQLLPALVVGTLPAAAIGLLWEKDIEALFHNPVAVTVPLAVVGALLWWGDSRSSSLRSLRELSVRDGFIIGLAQATALIPGVSRSGATILGGRLLGYGRYDAARFSFLLGTPAMAGAALLKAPELSAAAFEPVFYVGAGVSLVTGCLTIKFFLRFLKTFGFAAFALYRFALAAVIYALAA